MARPMQPVQQPLVWQGRLQLGDEPGTFGDAAYVGLGIELPVTIHPIPPDPKAAPKKPQITLQLHVENMRTYPPYPGHRLLVFAHVPQPGTNPPQWQQVGPILREVLPHEGSDFSFPLDLGSLGLPAFLSIRLHCDVTVAAGLYNDFVLTRLSIGDANFACYATFGFEYDAH
jgi:hypothetical protein